MLSINATSPRHANELFNKYINGSKSNDFWLVLCENDWYYSSHQEIIQNMINFGVNFMFISHRYSPAANSVHINNDVFKENSFTLFQSGKIIEQFSTSLNLETMQKCINRSVSQNVPSVNQIIKTAKASKDIIFLKLLIDQEYHRLSVKLSSLTFSRLEEIIQNIIQKKLIDKISYIDDFMDKIIISDDNELQEAIRITQLINRTKPTNYELFCLNITTKPNQLEEIFTGEIMDDVSYTRPSTPRYVSEELMELDDIANPRKIINNSITRKFNSSTINEEPEFMGLEAIANPLKIVCSTPKSNKNYEKLRALDDLFTQIEQKSSSKDSNEIFNVVENYNK